jgi:hypothetical protein
MPLCAIEVLCGPWCAPAHPLRRRRRRCSGLFFVASPVDVWLRSTKKHERGGHRGGGGEEIKNEGEGAGEGGRGWVGGRGNPKRPRDEREGGGCPHHTECPALQCVQLSGDQSRKRRFQPCTAMQPRKQGLGSACARMSMCGGTIPQWGPEPSLGQIAIT